MQLMDPMQNMPCSSLRWHLLLTKPANEECASMHLERQGYGVYFPRLQEKVLRRGKWRDRIAPLFPRYLFLRLDSILQSLAPARSTVGVSSVVRFGVDYLVVPDHVVATLQSNADQNTGLHKLRAADWFKRGDQIRIAAGALSGLEGIFESVDGSERVTILLNLLGRETRIQIDAGYVTRSAA